MASVSSDDQLIQALAVPTAPGLCLAVRDIVCLSPSFHLPDWLYLRRMGVETP
jgi:hypothetical protein